MTQIKKAIVCALTCATMSTQVVAGDATAGKAKAVMCAACHGVNGKASNPTYPNLAGQNTAYLVSAMQAYKSGQRTSPMASMMKGMVASLSDDDMKNLAAYFSSLK